MTKEELEQARENVKRADELLTTIELLENANPFQNGLNVRFATLDTNDDLLPHGLLLRVIDEGRKSLIEQLQDEFGSISTLKSEVTK